MGNPVLHLFAVAEFPRWQSVCRRQEWHLAGWHLGRRMELDRFGPRSSLRWGRRFVERLQLAAAVCCRLLFCLQLCFQRWSRFEPHCRCRFLNFSLTASRILHLACLGGSALRCFPLRHGRAVFLFFFLFAHGLVLLSSRVFGPSPIYTLGQLPRLYTSVFSRGDSPTVFPKLPPV